MKRQIIHIDEDKCIGCSLCANACQEGAIGMVDGKAKLLRDDYCDGLGNCLPVCPTGAISFVEREAAAFDKEAVKKNKDAMKNEQEAEKAPRAFSGCPGTMAKSIQQKNANMNQQTQNKIVDNTSQLNQWPVQIKLVPVNAPYFNNARLLIAADCTAYAYANFHNEFMKNKVTIIGCPKLDEGDYSDKLTAILAENNIKSVTVVRMEVPCCGGLERAAITALKNSDKMIPWQIVTVSIDGEIIDD